ncbi:MAG: hypothetical protein HRT81_12455 [Henriciella sp.]|nr:hypothetical protein [Henriciella sp.]
MNVPPERDSSGRFVKPEQEAPKPSDENMHPMSKLLFGWVGSPRTPLILLVLVIVICAGLVVFDLTVNRHEYLDFANANGFYALWGFAAFALAVLSGWPLGKLLRRDEDYYGEAETTPQDVESDS